MKRWTVGIAKVARLQLEAISDNRIRESIGRSIDKLEVDPHKQGKPLGEELTGYRAVRTAGQRYRIIYRIEAEQISVLVVFIGRRKEGDRKDVYTLAQKLARLGLLD